MNQSTHDFSELFAQLGLPTDEHSIKLFLKMHANLCDGCRVHDAPFWTDSQRAFLRDALLQDADWAPIVDQLNHALHSSTQTSKESAEPLNLSV